MTEPRMSNRALSRDVAHIQEDLAASLAYAIGTDPTEDVRLMVQSIVSDVTCWEDSQQSLIDVLERLGVAVFGEMSLFHFGARTSLMGQTEVFTSGRWLAGRGFAVSDLQWPVNQLSPIFAEHAAPENADRDARLAAAVETWKTQVGLADNPHA